MRYHIAQAAVRDIISPKQPCEVIEPPSAARLRKFAPSRPSYGGASASRPQRKEIHNSTGTYKVTASQYIIAPKQPYIMSPNNASRCRDFRENSTRTYEETASQCD